MPAAGRSCAATPASQPGTGAAPEAVEHLARTLLRRYGVVFWRLLEREAAWLPPWRDLLRVYRRLERRGEIRGGRFVAGFSGRAVRLARSRRRPARDPAQGATAMRWSRCPAPTRSTSRAF